MFAIAGIALATAIPGFLAGVWLHEESTIEYKRGSPTEEFVTTQKAKAPEAPRPRRVVLRLPWPTYGLRVQRTHTSEDFKLRPPFRLRWTFKAGHVLEFPPSIAYGRLYFAQQRGSVLRHPPPHRQGRLAAALQQLLGRLADRRLPRRLPRVDAAAAMQPLSAEPARAGRRDGGPDREDRLALPGRRLRVVTARRGQDALRRLVGPQAPRGQHLHRQGRAGRSPPTPRSTARRRSRTERSTSERTAAASTRWTPARAASAGARKRSPASGAASSSTPRRRSRTAASSSGTPTARSTPSAPRAGGCCGPSAPATTSTRRPRSGGSGSTSARTTVSSWRSTRRPGTGCGASRPRPRSTARRASSTVSSTSPPAPAVAATPPGRPGAATAAPTP